MNDQFEAANRLMVYMTDYLGDTILDYDTNSVLVGRLYKLGWTAECTCLIIITLFLVLDNNIANRDQLERMGFNFDSILSAIRIKSYHCDSSIADKRILLSDKDATMAYEVLLRSIDEVWYRRGCKEAREALHHLGLL